MEQVLLLKGDARLEGFHVLSEYECGRAQMAIEWVARSQKPIVEIGGCPIKGCNLYDLANDLNRCILLSGESVRAFVMPDRAKGYCCYGFYRYEWAIRALLVLWGDQTPKGPYHSLWLQGLLFGYGPDAIQRFISSASCAQASNTHLRQHSVFARYCKVEMYGPLARLFRRYSNQNGKCQKLG